MVFPPGEYRLFVRTESHVAAPSPTDIQAYFEQFGEVLDVYRPPRTPDLCYVTFGDAEALQAAAHDPRPSVGDVVCVVQQAAPRASLGRRPSSAASALPSAQPAYASETIAFPSSVAATAAPAADRNRVFVTGLVDQVDEEWLRSYFSQFGGVKDVYIPVDRNTGCKKSFSFVTMTTAEEISAIISLISHDIGQGIIVTASPAESREATKGCSTGFLTPSVRTAAAPPARSASAFRAAPYPTAVPAAAVPAVVPDRVYVTGLVDQVDDEWLRSYFSQFGGVKDVYIPVDKNTGCKKSFSFVTMTTAEEISAIVDLISHDIGEGIVVTTTRAESREGAKSGGKGGKGFFTPGGPTAAPPPAQSAYALRAAPVPSTIAAGATAAVDRNRVFVTGLVDLVDEEWLRSHFSQFGGVKDVYIPVDRNTGCKKPFSFVTMTTAEEISAIITLISHDIGEGIIVTASPAESREATKGGSTAFGGYAPVRAAFPLAANAPLQGVSGDNRAFVFGMPEGLNADMLRGHFARHGEILDIYIPQRSPELAFVTFSSEEELQDALANSGNRIAGFLVNGVKQAEARDKLVGTNSSVGCFKGSGKGDRSFKPY